MSRNWHRLCFNRLAVSERDPEISGSLQSPIAVDSVSERSRETHRLVETGLSYPAKAHPTITPEQAERIPASFRPCSLFSQHVPQGVFQIGVLEFVTGFLQTLRDDASAGQQ